MRAEFRHREECSFKVVVILKDNLDDLANHPGLIRCTIDIEDRNRLDELSHRHFVLSNVILVNEESGGAAIDKCRGAMLDTQVGRFEFDIDSEGVVARGG